MSKDHFVIKPFSMVYYEQLKDFISTNWRKDHPVVASIDLFMWQYYGYGTIKGYNNFQLLFYNNILAGFRAVTPLEMQVPYKNTYSFYSCLGSTMWMVDSRFRGLGLGYKMHHNTELASDFSLAMGANIQTSVPIYLRNGYIEQKALHRYIIPLDSCFSSLLIYGNRNNYEIESWINTINIDNCKISSLVETNNINELESIWRHFSAGNEIIALNRSAEYWKWRYYDSPIFKYHIFGSIAEGGVLVVRIEDVYKGNAYTKIKALRILEFIPFNNLCWNGFIDEKFIILVRKVLKWGKFNNCSCADFYISTNRFSNILSSIGFRYQPIDYLPEYLSLSGVFQPISNSPYYYNTYLRIGIHDLDVKNFNYNNSYFAKSDTDQDRPNIIFDEKQ